MYALANSTITITRGFTLDPVTGDKVAASTPVYTGPGSITEQASRYFDQATQTPRTIRSLEMRVSSVADVRSGDYVTDTVRGTKFVVQDVSLSYGLLFTPDKVADLLRVN